MSKFKPTKPVIYIQQQIFKSTKAFIKLKKYVHSNERMTKHQLKILLEDLKIPLFEALDYSDGGENIEPKN